MSTFEKFSALAALATALLEKIEDIHVVPNCMNEANTAIGLAVLLEKLLKDEALEASRAL